MKHEALFEVNAKKNVKREKLKQRHELKNMLFNIWQHIEIIFSLPFVFGDQPILKNKFHCWIILDLDGLSCYCGL